MENINRTNRKKDFTEVIKERILSGALKPGDRLPPERELAEEMNISRGSVNQGILDLERLGFLRVVPRKGTFVADYINASTPDTLSVIMGYDSALIDPNLFSSLMDLRILIERESVRLACANRNAENLQRLGAATAQLFSCTPEALPDAMYAFHLNLTVISGNSAYVLVFRSFEKMIRALIARHYADPAEVRRVLPLYSELSVALMSGNETTACERISQILNSAADYLKRSGLSDCGE